MLRYHPNIHRCEHIKVNGTQCGSPSLRKKKHCFFHEQWRQQRLNIADSAPDVPAGISIAHALNLPPLEDANSIQLAIMQVLNLLLTGQVAHKTAALVLYGLQTASGNLRKVSFQSYPPDVVIDPDTVDQTLMGEELWKNSDFEDTEEDDDDSEEEDGEAEEADGAETENEDQQTPSLEECASIPALKASAETSPRKDNWDAWPASWRDELRTQITDMIRSAALHEGLGRQFAQAGHLSPHPGKPGGT